MKIKNQRKKFIKAIYHHVLHHVAHTHLLNIIITVVRRKKERNSRRLLLLVHNNNNNNNNNITIIIHHRKKKLKNRLQGKIKSKTLELLLRGKTFKHVASYFKVTNFSRDFLIKFLFSGLKLISFCLQKGRKWWRRLLCKLCVCCISNNLFIYLEVEVVRMREIGALMTRHLCN